MQHLRARPRPHPWTAIAGRWRAISWTAPPPRPAEPELESEAEAEPEPEAELAEAPAVELAEAPAVDGESDQAPATDGEPDKAPEAPAVESGPGEAPAVDGGTSDTAEPAAVPMAPAIDPRIWQRRVEVQRRQGRRRLHILLAVLGVFMLGGIALAAAHSPLLDVRHVRVIGAAHTDPEAIVHAAGLDRHHHLIDIRGAAVAAQVERLPWVRSVRVQVSWPSTVRLLVTERSPIAAMAATPGATPHRWALVDGSGRVVDVVDGLAPPLIRLVGVPAPGPAGSQLDAAAAGPLMILAALPPDLAARVSTVQLVSGTSAGSLPEIDLALTAGGIVRLGPPDSLADKMVAIRTVLARVDLHAVATIDVRVPSAPVLTRNA